MAEPLRREKSWTLAEFLHWYKEQRGRHEFSHGDILAMAPGTVLHNLTKGRAFRALGDAVARAGVPCTVLADGIGVAIDGRHWREPDAIVHCGSALEPDAIMVDRPVVVVEVLSPSTESDDMTSKLVEYFMVETVSHYLIMDPLRRLIIHHARGEAGRINTAILRTGPLLLDPPGLSLLVEEMFPAEEASEAEA